MKLTDCELCLKVINETDGVSMPKPIAPKVITKTDGVSMLQPIAPEAATETELPEQLLKIENYLRSTTGKPKRKKASVCSLSVKLYTLLMVAYFVESDDIDMNMDFSFGYCKKVYQYMQRICDVLNEGKHTKKIKSAEEVELLNEISASLKKSFLSVHLSSPHVTVRKLKLRLKHRQMIDYNQFFNIPPNDKSNGKKLDEVINCKAKIDDSIQKLVTEPSNGKKLDEAINLNKNAKQLHENRDTDTNQLNFIIKNVTEGKIHDMDEKITEKKKENFGKESRSENGPIETDNKNSRDKFIDLIQEDLNNKNFNDNVLNSDIPSEIKSTSQSCHTNSHKNNIEMDSEVQKDRIDVLEYKEYSIVKIVLQEWEDLENLSRKIQESIMNYDYYYDDNFLKCHGIQNGGLLYYYSNEDWFKDILNKNFNANYSFEKIEKFEMKVHINSFIKVEDVLKALELHNRGLYTNDWTILEEGNCYFVVDVDCDSFQFVCDQRFSLFAGIDTALITIVL